MNRRALIAAPLALAACSGPPVAEAQVDIPPLKSVAPFPLGVAAMTEQFDDSAWGEVVGTHFDRVTPEWEMKAEAFARDDGTYDFSRADRLVERATGRGLSVFGHTIVWYTQAPAFLQRLTGDRRAFEEAYGRYVRTVAGRYRGRVVAWDVVNEPVLDDGQGYRTRHAFHEALGIDYVRLAFEHAREADPAAVLFLNDYNLEQLPKKRRDFLRLAESLLKAGAPLGGLGTQTHVPADLPVGAMDETLRDLASLGLPIHVSEVDISANRARGRHEPERVAAEIVDAFQGLPERLRWGVTIWGARHGDSWLNRGEEKNPLRPDRPLLFDDQGRPTSTAAAFVRALTT